MKAGLEAKIREAADAVDRCIADHKSGHPAPFSPKVLAQVRDELDVMARGLGHAPIYPRFLLDWPDEAGLKALLLDLAYQYGRAKG